MNYLSIATNLDKIKPSSKSYAHFSKGLSIRLSRRIQRRGVGRTMNRQSRPSWGLTSTFPGVFWPFPLYSNPKLQCFDPKSSNFCQFNPRNVIKTYPSQIIKSKRRILEAREEKKKPKNSSSRMSQAQEVPAPKVKYFSVLSFSQFLILLSWLNLGFLERWYNFMNLLNICSKPDYHVITQIIAWILEP